MNPIHAHLFDRVTVRTEDCIREGVIIGITRTILTVNCGGEILKCNPINVQQDSIVRLYDSDDISVLRNSTGEILIQKNNKISLRISPNTDGLTLSYTGQMISWKNNTISFCKRSYP